MKTKEITWSACRQEFHEREPPFDPELQLHEWPLRVLLELTNSLCQAWVVDEWYE